MPDAIVIGSGPNGLVAANMLAEAGWDVLVLEEQPEPGGAVRSARLPSGHIYDRFSAFYPLAVASPPMRALNLERYGLTWRRAPTVLSHPFLDGRSVSLHLDPKGTAASVEQFARGDGERWLDLLEQWRLISDELMDAILGRTFPPVAPLARLFGKLGPRGSMDMLRTLLLPVRRLSEERFHGEGATMLLAGNSLHADLAPEVNLSGFFGLVLAMIGQEQGFPVPQGGAGELTNALVRRFKAFGGRIECNAAVKSIIIKEKKACGVVLRGGERIHARRAILAALDAHTLYTKLIGPDCLPSRVLHSLEHFERDDSTFKIDWVMRGGIPWDSPQTRQAATVHLARGLDQLTDSSAQLAKKHIPSHPFLVMGQMANADPTRSPDGTQVVWAYARVPHRPAGDAGGDLKGVWDEKESDAFAERIEKEIEAFAPGFRNQISERCLQPPHVLEQGNSSLVGGAINGGSASLHQQIVFRPIPGLGRPSTPIAKLYLASSGAHPGGGVHGACGANAARAALGRIWTKSALIAAASAAALATAKRKR